MQRYFLIALADRHQWGTTVRFLLGLALLLVTVLMVAACVLVCYGAVHVIAWASTHR